MILDLFVNYCLIFFLTKFTLIPYELKVLIILNSSVCVKDEIISDIHFLFFLLSLSCFRKGTNWNVSYDIFFKRCYDIYIYCTDEMKCFSLKIDNPSLKQIYQYLFSWHRFFKKYHDIIALIKWRVLLLVKDSPNLSIVCGKHILIRVPTA